MLDLHDAPLVPCSLLWRESHLGPMHGIWQSAHRQWLDTGASSRRFPTSIRVDGIGQNLGVQ